jgi:hypothetical protein
MVAVLRSRLATSSAARHTLVFLVRKWTNGTKGHRRKHRAPDAEILGGHIRTRDLTQRVVLRATDAPLIDMLNEILLGKILHCPHDAGNAAVLHATPPGFTAFALEMKA